MMPQCCRSNAALAAPFRRDVTGLSIESRYLSLWLVSAFLLLGASSLVGFWSSAETTSGGLFREVAPASIGIDWVHVNAQSEHRYLPETIPPGLAIFDYNNDGWMDILLINTGESVFYHPQTPPETKLFRNNGDGTFADVTRKAGIRPNFFGMGVAVGDYDGDGYNDIFLTGYERCYLYHNNGDGTFADVTQASQIAPPGFSTSAVWFDYNNDGKLDLFVGPICGLLQPADLYQRYGLWRHDRERARQPDPLLLSEDLPSDAKPFISERRKWTVYGCEQGSRSTRIARKGIRSRCHRYQ
jgi:VCBS repeat protein